jgi:polar amino acid transport system substrate-binding protein
MPSTRTRIGVVAGLVAVAAVAAVSLLSGTASGTSAAATEYVTSPTLDRVKSSGTLRACFDPEFPPQVYLKNGQPDGLDIALTRQLAANIGVKVQFVQTNFDGLIAGLQANKCDISLSGMTPRGKRALSVSFAKPTVVAGEVVAVRANERRTTIRALNQPSVRFCAQTGTGSETDQKRYFPRAKVTKVPSAEACLLQLLAGRADAVVTDTVTGNGWTKAHRGKLKLVLANAGLPAAPSGPAVQLGDLAFVAYLNVFFGEFINNGLYEPIFRREMGYEPDMAALARQRGNF